MCAWSIGVFDSGIGGLTIARAIKDLLPQESIVYVGDTAHHPYGENSTAVIQDRAKKICTFLRSARCKIILVACNTVSAVAHDTIYRQVGRQVAVLDVVDPMVEYLVQQFSDCAVGLIGTQQTVQSGIYSQKIRALKGVIHLRPLSTPLLAPMIETGFASGFIDPKIIQGCFQASYLRSIRALALGCTHYSLIKAQLRTFCQGKVEIVDAPQLTAQMIQKCLTNYQLLNRATTGTRDRFFASALTPSFEAAVKLFFQQSGSVVNLSI